MKAFKKTFGDFDRIDVEGDADLDCLTIKQRVGFTDEQRFLFIRSEEAVRDLHYALGRYLAHLDRIEDRQ